LPTPDTDTERLRRLHDAYVEKVNLVLEEGREDLVPTLVESYDDEALRILTTVQPAAPPPPGAIRH
jgi:hypothetical protein